MLFKETAFESLLFIEFLISNDGSVSQWTPCRNLVVWFFNKTWTDLEKERDGSCQRGKRKSEGRFSHLGARAE